MAKARSIEQHLMRFPSRQIREPDRRGRTLEGKQPVAPDAREGSENFRQLLAAHALDRISPDAVDPTNRSHTPASLIEFFRRYQAAGVRANRSPVDTPSRYARPSPRQTICSEIGRSVAVRPLGTARAQRSRKLTKRVK